MNDAQRKNYIMAARAAFERSREADFAEFRHREVAWALGAAKSFSRFDEMDLTRAVIHFQYLARGDRLDPAEIQRLAIERSLRAFRPLWEAIEPRIRARVLRDRFKITFFEELAGLQGRPLVEMQITLRRLAREYPVQTSPQPTEVPS